MARTFSKIIIIEKDKTEVLENIFCACERFGVSRSCVSEHIRTGTPLRRNGKNYYFDFLFEERGEE